MKKFMKTIFCAAAIVACLALAGQAKATIKYELDYSFGAVTPDGSGPWLEASFTTTATGVDLFLEANLSGSTEKFRFIYFNFNDSKDLSALTFGYSDPSIDGITRTTANAQKADGDGFYDILVELNQSGTTNLFNNSDTMTISIGGLSGITENDFAYYSEYGGGQGVYHVAAHVLGTGGGGGSDWIGDTDGGLPPVPEPATMFLLGTGLVGIAGAARRRKKNQA